MKKVAAIIVVLALAAGSIWYYEAHKGSSNAPAKTAPVKVAPATTHPDPSNATFTFDDGPITLKNGSAETDVTPNGEITEDTTLTDDIAYGDINNDGKTDAAVLLVQSGGGSGVFLYVGAYLSGVVQYAGSNAVFIGDRVSPKTIAVDKSGAITVTYLDRKPGEAMADDPTILTTKHYVYKGGQLEEN